MRIMCADMVEISWKGRGGMQRRGTALLEDISPSGACLQLEAPVPLGVEVRVDCAQRRFLGWVRYCAYREIGYFVGVEFDAGTKWSKRMYKPRHLLDLEKFLAPK
ncbi:MAG: PilZ domain-containing protein [Acidobacteriia bacterium]|nr:PilZ domain-containing protein [Terriglobia bacterium]